ncbi:glycosyltransferase family 4 protein [Patescibacteria group bacterium]|nr:glycosyltransferase family 4 protein [Patescibacteria group bacterium]
MRKKIYWVQVSSKKYGGSLYGEEVRKVLSEEFDIEVENLEARYLKWRYLKPFEWLLNFIKLKGKKDLWIISSFSDLALASSLSRIKGKKLAIIHHIDNSVFSLILKPFFFLIETFFYYSLKKTDTIVTVSEYWKKHFLDRGYSNVYKIYNPFNLADFNVSYQEALEFKKRFNLEGKPIVYIGNCQKEKGAIEVFKALKDLDVYLITSGERRVKIPTVNLNIEYKDYLRLLKASSIVITMSKFKEGWCRTAHEAMLCKTPVIGSGLGGMKELLEGGKQIICKNRQNLGEKVRYLLNHPEIRKKMGKDGYNFAKEFNLEKFEQEWMELIKKIL